MSQICLLAFARQIWTTSLSFWPFLTVIFLSVIEKTGMRVGEGEMDKGVIGN